MGVCVQGPPPGTSSHPQHVHGSLQNTPHTKAMEGHNQHNQHFQQLQQLQADKECFLKEYETHLRADMALFLAMRRKVNNKDANALKLSPTAGCVKEKPRYCDTESQDKKTQNTRIRLGHLGSYCSFPDENIQHLGCTIFLPQRGGIPCAFSFPIQQQPVQTDRVCIQVSLPDVPFDNGVVPCHVLSRCLLAFPFQSQL